MLLALVKLVKAVVIITDLYLWADRGEEVLRNSYGEIC